MKLYEKYLQYTKPLKARAAEWICMEQKRRPQSTDKYITNQKNQQTKQIAKLIKKKKKEEEVKLNP